MTTKCPQFIVIDTDGGGDDAMAILLALSDKEALKVLGITCCFGNTSLDNVCLNVMRTLTLCGETEIPVYRGCYGPLLQNDRKNIVFGTDGFGDHGHEFPTGNLKESDVPAPVALIQLAKKHPQQITLVTIGPLTNVAIAHRMDPDFSRNLKSIVCMGGNYKGIGNATEVAEFNFYCDPESAHVVLSELSCPIVLVPWEPVLEHGIEWQMFDKMTNMKTVKSEFMKRISGIYVERSKRKGNKRYYDADFLAVATLLDPDCVTESIEKAAVVECNGKFTKGQTILLRETSTEAETKRIRVVTSFSDDALNKLRFQMLK